jgi:RNA polymerase sigma factor (sigma-70 family)
MVTTQSIDLNSSTLLAEFVADHQTELQKYLYWQVRSHEIAEELVQETYVRFLKQAGTGKSQILDLRAFLFTIATNLARDHLRSLKRKEAYEFQEIDHTIPDNKPDTENIIANECLAKQLQQAIASLPEPTREIFLLYRADELSYKQIAARMEISERTVEYHLRQALLACRNKLTRS